MGSHCTVAGTEQPSAMLALVTWQKTETLAGASEEDMSSPATEDLSNCREALGICVAS